MKKPITRNKIWEAKIEMKARPGPNHGVEVSLAECAPKKHSIIFNHHLLLNIQNLSYLSPIASSSVSCMDLRQHIHEKVFLATNQRSNAREYSLMTNTPNTKPNKQSSKVGEMNSFEIALGSFPPFFSVSYFCWCIV